MTEYFLYIGVAIVAVFVSSVSQVLLKISSNKSYSSKLADYINPLVLSAYALLMLSTFVMVIAFRVIPLSIGPLIESLGYVFVAFAGVMVFHEKINKKRALGIILIVLGLIIASVQI